MSFITVLNDAQSFSPGALFAAGEVGVWYDPSDLSTLFQDTAGTTPVTAAGQSVALMLDKSGRGNHATQATAASRPIYSVVPQTGRRNLLTYSEQFDNAAWTKDTSSVTPNAAIAPDGTMSADLVAADGTSARHYVYQGIVQPVVSFYAKAAGYDYAVTEWIGSGRFAIFNLSTGSVSSSSADVTASMVSIGNGWYRCIAVYPDAVAASTRIRVGPFNSTSIGTYLFTGDGTSGIYIWGAQLELGTTATAYQRVVSQYDVTESGVPSLHYLSFDGTDDFLVTPTITPGTDKAQVFAGVRKLSDAAQALVVGLGNITQSGAFELFAPTAAAANDFNFSANGGTTFVQSAAGTRPSPITVVAAGVMDFALANGEVTNRINGAVAATSSGDAGTANFRTDVMRIGRRGGTSLPFNGHLYSLMVRFGPNLTAAQIAQAERWVNSKTRAY